jgi:Legionella pneumophila major outer membrane protein precursor
VALPTSQIGATVMPRFDFGYRFGEAAGELLVSYRFVTGQATSFTDDLPAFGPGGVSVTSRLNLNTIDLDYGSWEPRTVLGVDMKWRVGVRTLIEFNDSQADNGTLFQATSNHYAGAGPHAMVDFRRPIEGTGLALFGRIESAYVFGQLDQYYTENVTTAGISDFGVTHDRNFTQITPLEFQAGVTWTPAALPNFSVTAGYIFEHFFDLGSYETGQTAREELTIQGGFLRAEWRY